MSCIKEGCGYGEYGPQEGSFKVYSFGYLENKMRQGEWRSYLDKRKEKLISILNYRNDTINGSVKMWYPNGNLYTIAEYRNGKPDGFEVKFWETGDFSGVFYTQNEEDKFSVYQELKPFYISLSITNDSIYLNDRYQTQYRFDTLKNYFKIPKYP